MLSSRPKWLWSAPGLVGLTQVKPVGTQTQPQSEIVLGSIPVILGQAEHVHPVTNLANVASRSISRLNHKHQSYKLLNHPNSSTL